MTRPIPSLPCWTWRRQPPESQQSSPNKVSNQWLKVLCGISPSLVFKTDQILSSLDPFGTASNRVFESTEISFKRCLMVTEVGIWGPEGMAQAGVTGQGGEAEVVNECQTYHHHK